MRLPNRIILGFFALISSCGPAAGGDVDTERAGAETQAAEDATAAASPDAPALDAPLAPAAETQAPLPPLAFVGDRFVLAEGASAQTRVFDAKEGAWFVVPGRPVTGDPQSMGGFHDMGLAGKLGAPRVDAWGAAVLMRTPGGFAIIDLERRGAIVVEGAGDPANVTYAPAAGLVAVKDEATVELIRARDGARLVTPFEGAAHASPRLEAGAAYWTTPRGLVRVDPSALVAQTFETRAPITQAVGSRDGRLFLVKTQIGEGESAEVSLVSFERGAPVARFRIASASAADLTFSDDGAFAAWEENSDETGHVHMHVVDVARGSHIRFTGVAACGVAPETIEKISGGVIETDGSCNVGCPSVRWARVTERYDARSGAHLGTVTEPAAESYNEAASAIVEQWEPVARGAGVDLGALMLMPSGDAVVFGGAAGISRARASGKAIVLARSRGLGTGDIYWNDKGTLVAATVDHETRIWDGATGRVLW